LRCTTSEPSFSNSTSEIRELLLVCIDSKVPVVEAVVDLLIIPHIPLMEEETEEDLGQEVTAHHQELRLSKSSSPTPLSVPVRPLGAAIGLEKCAR
jgi:hypothetical protein